MFAVLGALAAESDAAAKFKTGVVLQQTAAGTQIKVTLTSTKRVSSRKKPRAVKIKATGKTVKLKKTNAAAVSAGYASSWQSKNFTGSYAGRLNALGGKRLKVTISSRTGKTIARPKAVVQTGAGGGGGGAGPLFTGPATELTGNDAFNHFGKWFLNSSFSDCAAGVWPACGSFETRYVHCQSGEFEYHYNTLSSDSDVHTYSNFTITGATAHVDGSWAVSYDENVFGGKYYWQVTNTGTATGQYQSSGGGIQNLGPLYWSQPAVTWQESSGACS